MSTDDLADELLRSAARLSRWASRNADLGMPDAQARVLSLVEELGPARVTTLATADDTSQPTMTSQVQRLVAEGLVHREPDPADARAGLVSLTPAGAAALAGARRARGRTLTPVLADLGVDEDHLRAVVALFDDVVQRFRAGSAAPAPSPDPSDPSDRSDREDT